MRRTRRAGGATASMRATGATPKPTRRRPAMHECSHSLPAVVEFSFTLLQVALPKYLPKYLKYFGRPSIFLAELQYGG